jgi:type IV secretory pathway TrbL component
MEALRLRLKDIDFAYSQIIVRESVHARFAKPRGAPESQNPSARTHCATASRRISSSAATTSAQSKSSWATQTSARRRYTHVMKKGAGAVKSPLD